MLLYHIDDNVRKYKMIKKLDFSISRLIFQLTTVKLGRRLVSVIIKSKRLKNKFLNESLSLEQVDDETEIKLENFLGDNSYNPEQILINHELNKEMIEKVKESLTDLEKQVFDLKINDFTYKEIAEILEMNPKAVDNATQRIRNKIKEILK